MSHITIIRPPAVSPKLSYSVGVVPPLGQAYLAASLLEAGHQVAGIDALGEAPLSRGPTNNPEMIYHGLSIPQVITHIDPRTDCICVTTMFSQQWPHVESLINAIHERFPDKPICTGGEHVTATWRYILETCPAVSVCALGEGEETIVDLAAWIDGHKTLDEIPGIAFRADGAPQRGAPRGRIRDVDSIPRPAWHLFPVNNYLDRGLGHGVNRGRSMPILATRGCPYQCTFCSNPQMWTTRYLMRNVEDVVDEIDSYVKRYRATNIDFYDLTAVIKRSWILSFCEQLERRGLNITYQLPTGTRAEALDAEVCRALSRTGCRNICFAPESGSQRILDDIKKRVTPDRILQSARDAIKEGIVVKTNLMIGFPDETWGDLWKTIRYGLKLVWIGVHDVPLFPVTPYPGSELYEQLRARGVLPELSNEYFTQLDFMDLGSPLSISRNFSPRQLGLIRNVGMATFILLGFARRPWRLWRTLRNLFRGASESALEQRIGEMRLRWSHPISRPDSQKSRSPIV